MLEEDAAYVEEAFLGERGLTSMFTEDQGTDDRGQAAVKAAYLTYIEGIQQHGDGRSWESTGSNRGPIVDQLAQSNHSSPGQEWCGMLIGDAYKKAGIRSEILKRLVFWSGYRLHLFFTQGKYLEGTFGSWWKPHQTLQLGSMSGERRKAALAGFQPQPGDVALFRSDYTHVGMITSYDASTGTLEIIEGNRGNRVQASAYDTGDNEITFIGRFNSTDYEPGGSVDQDVERAPMPNIRHDDNSQGSTR
jgi:hypothetical protein